jgi:hypothetical protein
VFAALDLPLMTMKHPELVTTVCRSLIKLHFEFLQRVRDVRPAYTPDLEGEVADPTSSLYEYENYDKDDSYYYEEAVEAEEEIEVGSNR